MRTVTLLGLTVLWLLSKQPLHPYELRQRMREQGLDQIVKVTHGALYYTVESLAKAELIVPAATNRQGRRPERTVYAITETGHEHATDRVRELLSTNAPEYSTYCAALAFMSMLSSDDAADRLELRRVLLEGELAAMQKRYDALIERGLPTVALVEMRHIQAHLRADIDITRSICEDIRSGALQWELEPVNAGREEGARGEGVVRDGDV